MNIEQIQKQIENISIDFVLIDHTDIDGLNTILSHFNDVCESVAVLGFKKLIEAASEGKKLVLQLINHETDDALVAMDKISEYITMMQKMIYEIQNGQLEIASESLTQPSSSGDDSNLLTDSVHQIEDMKPSGFKHPSKLPDHLDDQLFGEFLGLQNSVLEKMETHILDIEQGNTEKISGLKRLFHTIKGEAGFLNLEEVEALCHKTEDILETEDAQYLADIFLSVKDWLSKAFDYYAGGNVQPGSSKAILQEMDKAISLIQQKKQIASTNHVDTTGPVQTQADQERSRIVEYPAEILLQFVSITNLNITDGIAQLQYLLDDPNDQAHLKAIYEAVFQLKTLSHFLGFNDLYLLSHEVIRLLNLSIWEKQLLHPTIWIVVHQALEMTIRMNSSIEKSLSTDKVIHSEPGLSELIVQLQAYSSSTSSTSFSYFDQRLEEKKSLAEPSQTKTVQPETEVDKKSDEFKSDKVLETKKYESTLNVIKEKSTSSLRETVNVDSERLDRMVDMIGEMVIAESMVIQSEEIKHITSTEFNRHLRQLDKITRELQEIGLSLRMVPIRATFQKMGRVIRDLSKKSNKKVKFVMSGEDTELDKTIVDGIAEPLIHLVRNSIDHGIEDTEERIAVKKIDIGKIEMRAFHKGGCIYIEIEDDGRGLDRDLIIEKAKKQGLVGDAESMSDQDIYRLIFQSGFSTAKVVTDISGRGVGMDVVKTSIEALRGQVEIQSERGKGCIFSLRLPLTLAIIDGMVVRVKKERYIIPTLSIVTSKHLRRNDITCVLEKSNMIDNQGTLIPLFDLDQVFMSSRTKKEQLVDKIKYGSVLIVVIEEGNRQAGLIIDELIGKQQIVIKSLGDTLRHISGIAGGAIMSDGRVGLILDVGGLIKLAHKEA
ncbi:MAG: chemotaxis protein CheA [Desulfobacterales bacterium]|nr:chemotaxis protein CheA [Desulfobacterales bacterium]